MGLIGAAAISVGSTVFFGNGLTANVLTEPSFRLSLGLFGVMHVSGFKKVHPIIIICISAVLGIVFGYAGLNYGAEVFVATVLTWEKSVNENNTCRH